MAEDRIDLCLTFNRVSPDQFRASLTRAMRSSSYHRENISLKPTYAGDECWLSDKSHCGFAITPDREIISVFSCAAGDGTRLLNFAKTQYDELHLNCYNTTFLRNFYQKNGFKVLRQEPSWFPGKRDVIFMSYKKP